MNVSHAQIGECFNRTADFLDQRGWVQHKGKSFDGAVCAQVALMEVAMNMNIHPELMIDITTKTLQNSIPDWNDNHCKTKEDVTSMFRAQAAIHLAQEGNLENRHMPIQIVYGQIMCNGELVIDGEPMKIIYVNLGNTSPILKFYTESEFPYHDLANAKCLVALPELIPA